MTQILLNELCKTSHLLEDLNLSPSIKQLLWKSDITEIGQWIFNNDELELLGLYIKDINLKNFKELALIYYNGAYYTKGKHYFKEYPKKYNSKDYLNFVNQISNLFKSVLNTEFEKEDETLKLKVLLSLGEELLNHIAWGVYLCYQAGGVKKNIHISGLTPQTLQTFIDNLIFSSLIYRKIYLGFNPNEIIELFDKINKNFDKVKNNLGFIPKLSKERDTEGAFFRLRTGCNEIENFIHSLNLSKKMKEENIKIDSVVAPFYASLTSASLGYCSLKNHEKIEFLIHSYSIYEDHIKCGEWENLTKREILERLSKVPSLIRPTHYVENKNILIILHALAKGKVLKGLSHFYNTLGAKKVYITAVGCEPNQDLIKLTFVSPTFKYLGPAQLRHFQKEVHHIIKN